MCTEPRSTTLEVEMEDANTERSNFFGSSGFSSSMTKRASEKVISVMSDIRTC